MSALKQTAIATEETKHSADMECILIRGDLVYTCADDGKVKIWNTDLVLQKEVQAHDYAVYHLLIHEDKLFTASIDATIKVWRLPSLELVTTLTNNGDSVKRLASNGEKLFSGDERGEVVVFDLKTLASQNKYETVEEVWDLAVMGRLFFTVRDRGLNVTEVKEDNTSMYTVVKTFQARAPIYLSDDYLLYCEHGTGLKIYLHKNEPNSFPKLKEIDAHSKIITCLAGKKIGTTEKIVSGAYDNEVKVWELPSGNKLASFAVPVTPCAVAMASDGTVYVGASDGYLVKLSP